MHITCRRGVSAPILLVSYVREWGAVQSTILVCELDFASNASNKMILSILQLLQIVALATRKVRLERFLSQHAQLHAGGLCSGWNQIRVSTFINFELNIRYTYRNHEATHVQNTRRTCCFPNLPLAPYYMGGLGTMPLLTADKKQPIQGSRWVLGFWQMCGPSNPSRQKGFVSKPGAEPGSHFFHCQRKPTIQI